jgi:hypothetical protein
MKSSRVTTTPFHVPTVVIGRDADVTLAVVEGIRRRQASQASQPPAGIIARITRLWKGGVA